MLKYPAAPTMSTAGTLTSPEAMLYFLFRCFVASEASQSTVHNVASFTTLLRDHGHDPLTLTSAIESALQTMLSSYFETARVNVEAREWDEDPSQLMLVFRITVVRDNVTYDLSRAVQRDESSKWRDVFVR